MIKYQLSCKKCQSNFDSWFASSVEYEKLKKKKLLNCINCGSIKIEKSLMSPNLLKKINQTNTVGDKKFLDIKKKLKEYKKFIEKNLYIMEIKKEKKEFMEKPLRNK